MTASTIRIGVVTVSDRASRGEYQDLGGPAILDCLRDILSCPWEPVPRLIPDEQPLIETTLKNSAMSKNAVSSSPPAAPGRRGAM